MLHPLLDALGRHEAELRAIRQDLHRHPELGFAETRTAGIVAARLRGWGIEVVEGLAGTGVVGTLRGRRSGAGTPPRAIALRADMDALPIAENTALSYASANPGVMHACGHDGHTAMLLGAARHLAESPDFAGTVHFIFQPAEEGLGGGRVMVEEGLFDRFPVEAVFGLHNEPGLPAGRFGIRTGPMLANVDTWSVRFHGTGGHGAVPHRATDPTLPLAQFLGALPGVAGIAEVASGPYPDATQFDPASDYHDPKATQETPRWISVDVRAVEQGRYLPLSEMREIAALEDMVLLKKGSRLSVSPVTQAEWDAVTALVRGKGA